MTDTLRKRLEKVRLALLALHKALVDSERASYEQTMGVIKSPNHFLKLLTDDPWFAWLKPISSLIVSMDEALDMKESPGDSVVEALLKETHVLLVPSENGEGFGRHYFDALQRDPNVILAHADVTKLFEKRKPK
ncbi:MAG TPA: hypothetical protein VMH87_02925 [Pseudomonadales bacterium]|nr:hypothetical protein [Pseudomonadales bacterium]